MRKKSSLAPGVVSVIFVFLSSISFLILTIGCNNAAPGKPALPKSDLPQQVLIHYSWLGLSPHAIREEYALTLAADHQTYQSQATLSKIPGDSTKPKQTRTHQSVVQSGQIKALMDAVQAEPWKSTTKPVEVIEHTDDYPNWVLRLDFEDGNIVKLSSTSNTRGHLPWNLTRENQHFVSTDGIALSQSIASLVKTIRPAEKPTVTVP